MADVVDSTFAFLVSTRRRWTFSHSLGRLLPFEAAFNREPFAGRGRAPTLHRAFFLRAYLLQTHVMLFDARHNAFVAWGGIPAKRGPPIWIRR